MTSVDEPKKNVYTTILIGFEPCNWKSYTGMMMGQLVFVFFLLLRSTGKENLKKKIYVRLLLLLLLIVGKLY